MKRILFIGIILQCMCSSIIHVQANALQGIVQICVQDENKRSIKGVEVNIRNEEGRVETLTSDQDGIVYLAKLQIGKYQLYISTPKGYQSYEKQEFYITQYTQKTGMEMTIQLHIKHKNPVIQSDALLLFICLCNMLFYFSIYVFKTYNAENFTQSFDDFMV